MSYQPYPTSAQPSQAPARPETPRSVQTAVKFMYAGAALSLISLIVALTTIGSLRSAIVKKYPKWTGHQIHTAEVADIVFLVVLALIGIGLWIWMARANQAGHSYARITGTVFFGIYTVLSLLSLARPHAGVGLVLNILVWLAGLGATLFLWHKDSAPFFAKTPTD